MTDGRQWVWSQNCGGRREIHRLYTLLRLSQLVTLPCFKASGPACIKLCASLGIFITNQGTSGGSDDIGTTRRALWEEEDASVRAAGGILQGKLLHPGGKQGMSTLGSGGNKGVQKVL